MTPYVLFSEKHYKDFLGKRSLSDTIDSFRLFLKEIGTSSLFFERPIPDCESHYHQVPSSTCIRLRTVEDYNRVVHTTLYEKQDKSRRQSSCSIV